MYTNKCSVNILTSILVAKGVRRAVVCPGSRNIPIVHNLSECESIECFPVTDERSAAFYALGIALATRQPVVVCVTSGSAILNTAPAVSEAFYRHVPLIVVSADRPMEWIGRQDGQTMLQYGALANIVKRQVDIDDVNVGDTVKIRHAGLLLNTALNAAMSGECGPVHVNMHLDEPLFGFSTEKFLDGFDITMLSDDFHCLPCGCDDVMDRFLSADSQMLVIGQLPYSDVEIDSIVKELRKCFVVVNEPLSSAYSCVLDKIVGTIANSTEEKAHVDFVLSIGGTFVSKNFRNFMRNAYVDEHWEISRSGEIHDTFMHQTGIVCCNEKLFLKRLLEKSLERSVAKGAFFRTWKHQADKVSMALEQYEPTFSQLYVVKTFEQSLEDMDYEYEVHYANSMAVRLGCMYSQHYIWCNRGINGIEGSISTAAGFSLATTSMTFCVTGDLSFLYDQNALWNGMLRGNLRILIINNGGGFIFSRLKGLDCTDKSMPYIQGKHIVNASGICEQNDIGYLAARNEQEYQKALVLFLTENTKRPMVLEVFTDVESDSKTFAQLDDFIMKGLA